MEKFNMWWETLDSLRQVLYCFAVPASACLVIQTLLILSGNVILPDVSDVSGIDFQATSADIPADVPHGASADTTDALHSADSSGFGFLSLLTVQGVMAFFCVFGWSGILLLGGGVFWLFALVAAFALGAACMYLEALLIHKISRLTQNGTLQLSRLIGVIGNVYLGIPEKGHGKVMIRTSERYLEFDAVSEGGVPIPTNTAVKVVDLREGNILVVSNTVAGNI